MSRPQPKRVRKSPEERRAEIVAAASAIALAEGLECVTLRRVADELAVRPGLISHYFPVTEDLVAEAFGDAASAELDDLIPAVRPGGAVSHLARFFALTSGPRYDGMSRLWLNARHLSRYRDTLRERVNHQEFLWRERLAALLRDGDAAGEFRAPEPELTAMRVLVVMDGLASHANTGRDVHPDPVKRMAAATAERELGLPEGRLAAPVPSPSTPPSTPPPASPSTAPA
ncbi:TetR family transcriptional regulator C-terminal domain-containing protein [Actinomadura rupiterrae]|uniref:TetR family transcriptional regulator C-terminal domain-containing protein n=1 Tax=Actinomadura rupiterrae TaxID=559627 RepID=UPI0020A43D51|nr:TetR family transcriptional regulator C-terminal domain-containing protein [Actinomadura rupiterrae]MCP2338995.1 AcrR family transcriptional regulator [Actinomadura rupiterrae]